MEVELPHTSSPGLCNLGQSPRDNFESTGKGSDIFLLFNCTRNPVRTLLFFCLVQQKLLYAPRVPAYGSPFEVESRIQYFIFAVQLKSLLLIPKVFVWNLDVAQTGVFIKWKE